MTYVSSYVYQIAKEKLKDLRNLSPLILTWTHQKMFMFTSKLSITFYVIWVKKIEKVSNKNSLLYAVITRLENLPNTTNKKSLFRWTIVTNVTNWLRNKIYCLITVAYDHNSNFQIIYDFPFTFSFSLHIFFRVSNKHFCSRLFINWCHKLQAKNTLTQYYILLLPLN